MALSRTLHPLAKSKRLCECRVSLRMRHQKKTIKLGRTAEHRRALLANQVCAFRPNAMGVTRASSNSARAKAILHAWRSSNGWTRSRSRRKSPAKKRKRNAKSPNRSCSRKSLKSNSPNGKSRRLKLPLRKRKNPLRHRQKNRSRKNDAGSAGSQARAKNSSCGVSCSLADATVILPNGSCVITPRALGARSMPESFRGSPKHPDRLRWCRRCAFAFMMATIYRNPAAYLRGASFGGRFPFTIAPATGMYESS